MKVIESVSRWKRWEPNKRGVFVELTDVAVLPNQSPLNLFPRALLAPTVLVWYHM